MAEYKIKAKKIGYHRATGRIIEVERASLGTIIFDSQYELNIFQKLEKIDNIKVIVHDFIAHIKWWIDFTIILDKPSKIPKQLEYLNLRPHKGKFLYMDAKGVIDARTYNRIKLMNRNLQRSIVLVCDNTELTNIGATPIIRSTRLNQDNKV